MNQNCKIYGGWAKTQAIFFGVYGPKFIKLWDIVGYSV